MMGKFVRRIGLIGMLVGAMASITGHAAVASEITEIFIPGGAFALDDAQWASYRHAGGSLSGQGFNAQGVWLPPDRGTIVVGTTFWVPTAWFDQEIEIILIAHSGMFIGEPRRIIYSIGQLFNQEFTAVVGPEDGGGSQVPLLTTTLGSTGPVPGGSVLANQQLQGIQVGINGNHPDNLGAGYGILGLLVRLTGN